MKRTLSDALRAAIRTGAVSLWGAMPGRIESYDPSTQKASVKPLLMRYDPETGQGVSRPIITGVPVVWPRSGGASMTMPVQRGDGVLIIFVDRSMDRWLSEGGEVLPDDRRAHDYSDAVAIPGLIPFAGAEGHDNDAVVLKYSGSEFRLEQSGDMVVDAAGDVVVRGKQFRWEAK